ncbi:MAG: phosphoribosyl-AMP cyclohydrolase [Victivallaceae bacterium]|nr:phosphoribosyl-AMP cyclohydrolase [Victivallaceae bacterium]
MNALDLLDFSKSPDGLIPAVAQDADTGEVLMVAYANRAAVEKALACGDAVYYSRSRKELWHKGSTSGHTQKLREVRVDCDLDCVLYLVEPRGPACHTGKRSCFFRRIVNGELQDMEE